MGLRALTHAFRSCGWCRALTNVEVMERREDAFGTPHLCLACWEMAEDEAASEEHEDGCPCERCRRYEQRVHQAYQRELVRKPEHAALEVISGDAEDALDIKF